MRKKWAEGTVLYTRDGAEYKITASNEAGGTAIIYYAEKAGSGIRAVLKEFYPQEWERRKGVPVERAYVDSPDEDPGLLSCYEKLAKQAAREMEISQKVARETVHVWPVRGMLEVQSIREPDGTVWQAEGTLPCCILEMDNLNHKDGLWLQDILREAGKKKSKETPLGNLQPNSKPVLAVPPLQVTLMLVWRLLILLAKIHEAGYLHGDINLGNVFLAMDDKGANVLNAMLIDFGSARALVDGETAPLGEESVMATPGFAAPELKGGGEQRLTPKADVYAVGKLMHCLLDQNILEALRKGWYSNLEEELKAPMLNASGINDPQLTPAVQKSLDRILSGAAEIKPEKRSSVQEMMEQIMQLYRKIEPPAWQMSLGLLQLNGDEVLGRDKDIKKIEAKLWAEGKLVLHGFSGIGKTKLVTLLGHKWQRNYPCSQVYYAFYPGSMTGLAVDTLARNMSTVAFTEQKDGKDVPRPVAGIIDDMFRELNAHMHENDLLIIDNVDDDTKKFWNSVVHEETVQGQTDLFTRLCQLNCKVLFVTRLDVSDVAGIVPFEVDKLEPKSLRAILRENSKDAKGHSDAQKRSDEELDRLIALVDRHTMTVDMIARTMRESRLTVPEIYKELSCDGYDSGAFAEISGQKDTDYSENRIEEHLIRLFRLANFNEREQDMLRYAQLIGENSGMYETLFLSCCPHESKDENTKNLEALNHLLRLGYVQQKTEKDSEEVILNLHTLVRVVAKKELVITPEQCDKFLERAQAEFDSNNEDVSSDGHIPEKTLSGAYNEAWKMYAGKTPMAYLWASYLINYQLEWAENTKYTGEDCACYAEVIPFALQDGAEAYPWIRQVYLNLFHWFNTEIIEWPEALYRLKKSEKFCRTFFEFTNECKNDEIALTFSEELQLLEKYAEVGQKILKMTETQAKQDEELLLWIYDKLHYLYKDLMHNQNDALHCAEEILKIAKQRYLGRFSAKFKDPFDGWKVVRINLESYYCDLGRTEELFRDFKIYRKYTELSETNPDIELNKNRVKECLRSVRYKIYNAAEVRFNDFNCWKDINHAFEMELYVFEDEQKYFEVLCDTISDLEQPVEEDEQNKTETLWNWTAAKLLEAQFYIHSNKTERLSFVFDLLENRLRLEAQNRRTPDEEFTRYYIGVCIMRSQFYAEQKNYKKAIDCIDEVIFITKSKEEYQRLNFFLRGEKASFYERCDCKAEAQAERNEVLKLFHAIKMLSPAECEISDLYFEITESLLYLLESEKRYTEKLDVLNVMIDTECKFIGGGLIIKKVGGQEKLEKYYQQAIETAQNLGKIAEARKLSRVAYKHFFENTKVAYKYFSEKGVDCPAKFIYPAEFIRVSCTRAYYVCRWDSTEAANILQEAFAWMGYILVEKIYRGITALQEEKLFSENAVDFFRMRLKALQETFPLETAVIHQQEQILKYAEEYGSI